MGKIIGTPFRSRNPLASKRINRRIKTLINNSAFKKKQIALEGLSDRIETRDLPNTKPGRIE